MLKTKMKKLSVLLSCDQLEDFLRELIELGCVQVIVPDDPPGDSELAALVRRVSVDIEQYQANQEKLVLLGTERTHLITGWIPAKSESTLRDMLSKFVCAWDVDSPSAEESDIVPVKPRLPMLFEEFYRNKGRLFTPLQSNKQDEE